jgi:deoxyribodipyrimidine photo-lyase
MCFLAQTGKSECAIRVRRQATVDRRTRVTMEIQEERIRPLNEKDVREGAYVLYWMQEAQRAEYNHALEYAVQRANDLEQRLLVVFGLTADYPEANQRHYAFMLEGLQDVYEALNEARSSS